jgi:uncharacterized protein YbjT (DUF2867 family)
MNADLEIQQGKNMADAAKETGVERFIWSSLANVTKGILHCLSLPSITKNANLRSVESGGKLTTVHHFDSKAKVEEYIRSIELPGTFVMPGLFMSYITGTALKKNEEGTYVFVTPFTPSSTKIPLFDPAADTGLFVAAALLHGDSTIGKRILAAGGYITPDEIISTFSSVTGEKAVVKQITFPQFHDALPGPVADELTGNFELVVDPGYYAGEKADALDQSIELVKTAGLRHPVTFKDWVEKTFQKA